MPNIAVCLICGNEENLISRCLDSAFTVSDTVVVVRAIGSQPPDNTLTIAKDRGCIVGEYRNSPATRTWPFVDDFAAARNLSFAIANDLPEPPDWLMWLDCDDVLDEGMGQRIQDAVAECKEDWILADYWLPQHGKPVPRERLFRRGSAAWVNGVHEKCVPISDDPKAETMKVRVRRDIRVTHDPLPGKSGSQERNMNILAWRDKETQHIKFYLHYENFLLSRREEAVKYGLEALRLHDLDGVYRYEVLLNMALLAEKNEHGQDMLKRAIKLCDHRREAWHLLALLQIDAKQYAEAIETANHCLTLPAPKVPEWTHRPDCYSWKSDATLAWAYRAAGQWDKAEEIEAQMLSRSTVPTISLLHATRGRWAKALSAMNTWKARAEHPESVEHIFAVDQDDAESLDKLSRFRHVVVPPGGYSVRAWNAAAKHAKGQILVQMADDFEAPPQWDSAIRRELGESLNKPRVLRVSDGLREDGLITLAIVTRRWFKENGLFDAAFINVYSDDDLTARATKKDAIIDARHLVFQHHHPVGGKGQWDETYTRGNNFDEYKRAKAIYETKHGTK
jgi:glycosyltransferase involved in cell wall biosynthesis